MVIVDTTVRWDHLPGTDTPHTVWQYWEIDCCVWGWPTWPCARCCRSCSRRR